MTDFDEVRAAFNPTRLRMARELAKVSQSDMARWVGVSSAAISQYELGSATPSSRAIRRFAAELGVEATFFMANDTGANLAGFFRSLRSAPAAERKRARHLVQLTYEIVRDIEREVRLPIADVPRHEVGADNDEEEPERAADAARKAWSVPRGPIENMVRLAERHGIVVTRLHSGHGGIDAFSVPYLERPVIVMSGAKGKRDRSRFDVAHELGHLVMHDPSETSTVRVENQAHSFAAAFLMPASDILHELPNELDWNQLVVLKQKWHVSLAALVRRCKTLRTFSPNTYTLAMKSMSARGWRRHEPFDLGDPESPLLLEKAIQVAGLKDSDISKRTSIPLNLVKEVLSLAADDRPEVVI